ncbi:MAG: hypothetical protein Q9196_007010 [Gyalolechia fulgens]
MASCTQLLRRINTTYTRVKLSISYLERAYGIDLRHSVLRQVHKAYLDSFGEPGIHDLASLVEDKTPCLPELGSPMNQAPMDVNPAVDAITIAAAIVPFTQTTHMGSSEAWDPDRWSSYSDLDVGHVPYPKVPAVAKPPDIYPSISRPFDGGEIAPTICSRCLMNLEAVNVAQEHEITMFLSPEWEDFRRVGLGILKS